MVQLLGTTSHDCDLQLSAGFPVDFACGGCEGDKLPDVTVCVKDLGSQERRLPRE